MEQTTSVRPEPFTGPMNLTCAPVTSRAQTGTVVYCIVYNASGQAQPPDNTWTPVANLGTTSYELSGTDFHGNSGKCPLTGTNIGIYSKTI